MRSLRAMDNGHRPLNRASSVKSEDTCTVLDRATLKPPLAGYQWTRKVGQKTMTVALSEEQFEAMRQAVENGRRLRKTLRAMEALSRKILFATTPDTRRFKPLNSKDLRLS
jgi:hypothetical protein